MPQTKWAASDCQFSLALRYRSATELHSLITSFFFAGELVALNSRLCAHYQNCETISLTLASLSLIFARALSGVHLIDLHTKNGERRKNKIFHKHIASVPIFLPNSISKSIYTWTIDKNAERCDEMRSLLSNLQLISLNEYKRRAQLVHGRSMNRWNK